MGADIPRSRVLLVEDEFLISDMLAGALAEHGFEVHAVATAEDALRHLRHGGPCDILVTDINLPGSADGAVLARLARALRPDLPVVYASGSYRSLDDLDAVPGALFVPKPYNPDRLCAMLGRMHSRRLTARALGLHPAFGKETLEPVDVIIAVDDVLGAHELAEQRQRRLDAVHDEFVERAFEPHQAFGAGLAVHDQLADQRVVERRDRVSLVDR